MKRTLLVIMFLLSFIQVCGAETAGVSFSELGKAFGPEPPSRWSRAWLHPDPRFKDVRVGGLSLETNIAAWPCLHKRTDLWSERKTYRPWRQTPPHACFGFITPEPIPMKRYSRDIEDKVFAEFRPEDDVTKPTVAERDWVHVTYSYELTSGGTLDFTANRLTPAVLVRSTGNKLMLFASNWQTLPIAGRGDKEASQAPMAQRLRQHAEEHPDSFYRPVLHRNVAPRLNYPGITIDYIDVCTHPDRVAMPTSDGVKIFSDTAVIDAAGMSEPWLLIWFGQGSPLPYDGDCPFLLVFQHKPQSVQCAKDGLDLRFEKECGAVALLPLDGMDYPPIAETAKWDKALPADVAARCRFWTPRLLQFPLTLRETGLWDEQAKAVEITGEIEWLSIADDWNTPHIRWAPLPSWAAVAAAGDMPVEIAGTVERADKADMFGAPAGVRDADGYTIRLGGLGKYLTETAVFGPAEDTELQTRLDKQLVELVDGGPYAPCYFVTGHPYDILWRDSSETIMALLAARPFAGADMQTRIDAFLRRWVEAHHPVLKPDLPADEGRRREWYQVPEMMLKRTHGGALRAEAASGRRLYTLWAYARATGDSEALRSGWSAAQRVLADLFKNTEWAGGYAGGGIHDLNLQIAGAIAYARMAKQLGESADAEKASILAVRLMAARLACCQWADAVPITDLAFQSSLRTREHSYSPLPDRGFGCPQVYDMCTYGPVLGKHSAYESARFPQRFQNLTPEVARLLADFDRPATEAYLAAAAAQRPLWYISDGPNTVAGSTTMMHPGYTWQLFQAQAYILRRPADQLKMYLDVPLVQADLYYMENLSAVLAAGAEQTWQPIP